MLPGRNGLLVFNPFGNCIVQMLIRIHRSILIIMDGNTSGKSGLWIIRYIWPCCKDVFFFSFVSQIQLLPQSTFK